LNWDRGRGNRHSAFDGSDDQCSGAPGQPAWKPLSVKIIRHNAGCDDAAAGYGTRTTKHVLRRARLRSAA